MQLCWLPMLWLVVGWITITHFSRVSPKSISIDYSLSKIMQLLWCTSLFILVSLNILLHIYPHTALLTILDIVRVLLISSMYLNFNLQFTTPLSSLASVLPLTLPLFEIHCLKVYVHPPLLPLLERSSKSISMQRHILLSLFSHMASPWY